MATPADQRLLDLLDKWLKSLELHLKYVALDDDHYLKAQHWPEHQRPSRWILELARQKAIALHSQLQNRVESGDATFSDSLELMAFLANLVGSEHIERFIPLANSDTEAAALPPPEVQPSSDVSTGTREMPQIKQTKERAPPPAGTPAVARTERKVVATPAATATSSTGSTGSKLSPESMHDQVIADAARLVQWGRKWYELAELISGMADRPSLIDVRRILKDNKALIDTKAGRG